MSNQIKPEAERMTMAEWTEIRNAVSGRLRKASSIGDKASIDAAEALLGEGWVSPTQVRRWLDVEAEEQQRRLDERQRVDAEARANRPKVDLSLPPNNGRDFSGVRLR